jgi:hypothetical protein
MRRVVIALSVTAVLIAAMAFPASAAAARVAGAIPAPHAGPITAVAKITGAGTAWMTDVGGTSLWWENKGGITLYSDGSAKGTFYCVDLPDSPPGYAGVIWGAVTRWTLDNGLISLHVPSSTLILWNAPWNWSSHKLPKGTPQDGGSWRIQIQNFGRAGVGHWTLDVPNPEAVDGWFTFCLEQVTGGKILLRRLDGNDNGGDNNGEDDSRGD